LSVPATPDRGGNAIGVAASVYVSGCDAGYAREVTCPNCATEVPRGAKFCSECGARIEVPAEVSAERKVITALFCDLVGSTHLGERLDPEDLDAVLRRYRALSRTRIEASGGVVEKFIGDAVVGLFGVPVANEDDPSRAVAAACAIVEDLRAADLGIEVRIGVNTGDAFVHPSVDPHSGEGVATGDCMNTAARLQSLAPPMGIVVGERTRAAIRTFAFEMLGQATVKGKAQPLVLWQVIGATAPEPWDRETTPFVGRVAELALLRQAVADLLDGNGGVIVVDGAPGIGKSRLARKLRAESPATRWLLGRSVETRDTRGYRPFGEQIRAWAGTEPADWTALTDSATDLDIPASDVPFLAALADVEPPASVAARVEALPADVVGTSIYRAARTWLDALASQTPLVLEFEDWHWADAASVQLLDHVLPLVAARPILVLVLTRGGSATSTAALGPTLTGARSGRSWTLSLEPLTDSDAGTLLQAVARGRLSKEQLAAARTRAEGNPYYLQELARFLQEHGARIGALPDTVRGVVASRVDRLDPDLRQLLRVASVIGRAFHIDLLPPQQSLDPTRNIDRLVATGLVNQPDPGKGTYRFAHALTRDAVYEGIPRARRREMHRAIASALTEGDGERANLPAIAYHLAQAEDWEEASASLLAAGEEAARLASDDEALEMYTAAIQAHERLPKDRWTPLARATIDRQVAETLVRLGRHDEAMRQVVSALATLGVQVTDSRAGVRRATLQQLVPRLFGPPRIPAATTAPDPRELEIARELELLGWITYYTDADRYALATMLLTNRAARAGLLEGTAVGTWRCALAFGSLGRATLAYRYMNRALEAADLLSNPVEIARLKQGLALVPFAFGTCDEAQAQARIGIDLGGAVGDLRSWGTGTGVFTWAAICHGDFEGAQVQAEELARAGAEGGDRQIEGFGLALMGIADFYRGDTERAIPQLRKAIDTLLQVPDYISAVGTSGVLARALLLVNDTTAARDAISWSREQVSARGFRGFFLSLLVEAESELAMLELATGRGWRTAAASARAVTSSNRHGKVCRWHLVHAHVMEGCRSWLLGRRKRARRAWAKGAALADRLGYQGVAEEAHRWVAHCCEVAGIDPPT